MKNLLAMRDQLPFAALASASCQEQINRVERGDDSVEKLQKRLADHADRLVTEVMPGIYDGSDGPLRNETFDELRDKALKELRAKALKKGASEKQTDQFMKQEDFMKKTADMLAKSIIGAVNALDEGKKEVALDHIIMGKLQVTTDEGRKARAAIFKALVEAQIKSSANSSMMRYKRNLEMD